MMSKEEFMALPMEEAANIASERGMAAMQRASAAVAGAEQPESGGEANMDEQQIKRLIDENMGKGSDAILAALKKAGAISGHAEPDGDEGKKPPMDGKPPAAEQPPKDDEPPMDDEDPMAVARKRAAGKGAAMKPPFGGGGMPAFGK